MTKVCLTDELLDQLGDSYQEFKKLTPDVSFDQFVVGVLEGIEYEINYCPPVRLSS